MSDLSTCEECIFSEFGNDSLCAVHEKEFMEEQMSEQICPCSSACDPKNYEGRLMLFLDEAWHNWYLNMRDHPPGKEHREGCGDCMDNYMELEVLKNDGS